MTPSFAAGSDIDYRCEARFWFAVLSSGLEFKEQVEIPLDGTVQAGDVEGNIFEDRVGGGDSCFEDFEPVETPVIEGDSSRELRFDRTLGSEAVDQFADEFKLGVAFLGCHTSHD